mmetsp:Transcript_33367/g.89300  ORF Transcript_33367/g.89300 Transcript_33367/m.89300 type:complete len:88 (-) Transcript_33367:95-358(-)
MLTRCPRTINRKRSKGYSQATLHTATLPVTFKTNEKELRDRKTVSFWSVFNILELSVGSVDTIKKPTKAITPAIVQRPIAGTEGESL